MSMYCSGHGHNLPCPTCAESLARRLEQDAAHTPGPWRWEFNNEAKSVYMVGGKPMFDKTVMQFARWGMSKATPLFNSKITGDQYNVMERLCDRPEWTKPFTGLEHHASWRMDVIHPDAVLMASAPDLLAALQRLVQQVETRFFDHVSADHPDSAVHSARAAMDKAVQP